MALHVTSVVARRIIQSKNHLWKRSKTVLRPYSSSEWDNLTQRPRNKVTDMPPMSQPVRGLPKAVYADYKEEDQQTKVSVLPNGIRVASENRFGEFCTVGVVIDSGSRYEVAYPSGISHFLEKLAFNSTKHYPDRDKMLSRLEQHGGVWDSQASRDTFIVAASAYTSGINDVIRVLAETCLRPRITDEELDGARQAISFELESLNMRPEQETLLLDMIHAAAYRENTLGLPKLCPPENLVEIDRDILFTYLSNYYTPKRMVVAGVGVEHSQLVDAVSKYFVEEKPIWQTIPNLLIQTNKDLGPDNSLAQYTGGMVQEECDIPQFASAGLPVLSHVMIGLEGNYFCETPPRIFFLNF